MTLDECERMMGRLCKLFPQTTREQSKAAGKQFRRFATKTVEEALDEHVKNFQFFTLSELLKHCEEAERQPDANGRPAIPDQSCADVFRGLDPQLRPVKSDVEVILRSYRKQWHACGQRAEYRASLKRQCATSLMTGARIDGIAFTTASAENWAETIFADVETMKQVLEDLRANHTSGPSPMQDDAVAWRRSLDGIRDHFESAWRAVLEGCEDPHGRAAARASLFRHAVMSLLAFSSDGQRMDPGEADEMGRRFVGLEPGQRIPRPEQRFASQIQVEPPQASFDALEQLARHEVQAAPEHPAEVPVG